MASTEHTLPDMVDFLLTGYWEWSGYTGSTPRRFKSNDITVNFKGLQKLDIPLAKEALALWSEVADITFTKGVKLFSEIVFTNSYEGSTTGGHGHADPKDSVFGPYLKKSTVRIATDIKPYVDDSELNIGDDFLDSFRFFTFVHEIGHALGLGHLGEYNGATSKESVDNIVFSDDSALLSIMSYIVPADNPNIEIGDGFENRYRGSLGLLDIMAIQQLYGTRASNTGDTTYGVGNTASNRLFDIKNIDKTFLTIFDSSGIDTLNYSDTTKSQIIDLQPGSFSSVYGFSKNLSIAVATEIENAHGGNGRDTIFGNELDNTLHGHDKKDELYGGNGNDRLYGGDHNDKLFGGIGLDWLFGGDGNDTLDASQGNHFTEGNGDFIQPGLGKNTIIGNKSLYERGNGIDLSYRDTHGTGGVKIIAFADGSGTAKSNIRGKVNDTFTYVNWYDGTLEDDTFKGRGEGTWKGWSGVAGDDTFYGSDNFDEIFYTVDGFYEEGRSGVIVNFDTGTATDGFGDKDTFSNIEAVRGSAMTDHFIGTAKQSWVLFRGMAGNDKLEGTNGFEVASYETDAYHGGYSGIRANLVTGIIQDGFGDVDTVSNIDQVDGTAFADKIIAGTGHVFWLKGFGGNDKLTGGIERDYLYGGTGNDILKGGENADHFMLERGFDRDRIIDFEDGIDILEVLIAGATFDDFEISKKKSDTVIKYGSDKVILKNIDHNLIDETDFYFVFG